MEDDIIEALHEQVERLAGLLRRVLTLLSPFHDDEMMLMDEIRAALAAAEGMER